MSVVWAIVHRNLRLFFRDRLNVFFSLLGASTFSALLPAIIINVLVLFYALTPGVRESFNMA